MKIFTIGVYGMTEQQFFSALIEHNIDVFCDVRQRRGVRGRLYTFANSLYLQERLKRLGINYLYEKNLAPTKEIREKQWEVDKTNHLTKKCRSVLGNAFVKCYCEKVLESFDFNDFKSRLEDLSAKNVVIFCVESNHNACHRSLLAKKMQELYNCEVINL
ncbi:MAG: DUF488 domain-containing protein [Bacteroidales bacterium]|nr:DUF488 domain-containing protein [Bacteroidales bacterium]